MHPSQTEKTARFHDLHRSGCFVIPNPWDVGSARVLAQSGFRAVATTSSGYAWSTGRADNRVSCDDALEHFRSIAASVDIPVNGDFEGAFADEPDDVFTNITRACATGIAGVSIEDWTGDAENPLYVFALAVERVRAARRAIDESKTNVVLTARSEGFILGRPDLNETLRRLVAYADAGADCLYAPGIKSLTEIKTVVHTVAPKAVNVLVSTPFATVQQLADLDVRRISVGGALARAAWTGYLAAVRGIAEHGSFEGFVNLVTFDQMNELFS
ncbi:MAG TPA: isocitrate lyase/phosphoenolpyruvate mutase family protein [Longimicrobiales bacterium]|nr:isocitrate lyase/phosphoenolpyruvate mutase family protein [Longimicrobiales bacterium]